MAHSARTMGKCRQGSVAGVCWKRLRNAALVARGFIPAGLRSNPKDLHTTTSSRQVRPTHSLCPNPMARELAPAESVRGLGRSRPKPAKPLLQPHLFASIPQPRMTENKHRLFIFPQKNLPPSYSPLRLYLQLRRNSPACVSCLCFLSFYCTYRRLEYWIVVLCKILGKS